MRVIFIDITAYAVKNHKKRKKRNNKKKAAENFVF